jgi:hypothetical protein
MRVRELIEMLMELPEDLIVVVDCNSESIEATDVEIVQRVDYGGYFSHPYPHPNNRREPQDVVYIS